MRISVVLESARRRVRVVAVLAMLLPGWAAPGEVVEAADDPFASVIGVRTVVPDDARTARHLGTERTGTGVVIDGSGLVLTIGYLMLEAVEAELVVPGGSRVPARVVGYDHDTGFGLVRAGSDLGLEPAMLGESSDVAAGDRVLVVSFAEPRSVTPAFVVSRRVFAGYWEYLLEDAIFTSPPHGNYGGAALIGSDGALLGIGSLFVQDARAGEQQLPGNMFVPIDGLKPILDDLIREGRPSTPSHPWLGVYTNQAGGRVFITRLAREGPAETAGLRPGDIIIGVGGRRVSDLVDFLRKTWARGTAGTAIPLDILRPGAGDIRVERFVVPSRDRHDWLKLERGM